MCFQPQFEYILARSIQFGIKLTTDRHMNKQTDQQVDTRGTNIIINNTRR